MIGLDRESYKEGYNAALQDALRVIERSDSRVQNFLVNPVNLAILIKKELKSLELS